VKERKGETIDIAFFLSGSYRQISPRVELEGQLKYFSVSQERPKTK
jgi:hypothetical protein